MTLYHSTKPEAIKEGIDVSVGGKVGDFETSPGYVYLVGDKAIADAISQERGGITVAVEVPEEKVKMDFDQILNMDEEELADLRIRGIGDINPYDWDWWKENIGEYYRISERISPENITILSSIEVKKEVLEGSYKNLIAQI